MLIVSPLITVCIYYFHSPRCLGNIDLLWTRSWSPRLIGVTFMFSHRVMMNSGTDRPRHKHFFYGALLNKAVLNKTPAFLPFQHLKPKQDAEAAETLTRCLSWWVRDGLYGSTCVNIRTQKDSQTSQKSFKRFTEKQAADITEWRGAIGWVWRGERHNWTESLQRPGPDHRQCRW